MRLLLLLLATAALWANSSDGPAATLTANVVPSRDVQQTFNAEIAKRYLVLDVNISPQRKVLVERIDFSLTLRDITLRASNPRTVAWTEENRTPDTNNPVTTTSTTGVFIEKGTDAYGQHRTRTGVYEDVSVTNDPNRAPPPPATRRPENIERRLAGLALPEGNTVKPIAGYLFFPISNAKPKKGEKLALQWSIPEGEPLRVELRLK